MAMKKFNFRLERLRKYKEQIEEERKRSLAIVQNRLVNEKNKLTVIMSTRNRYLSSFGVRKAGKVNLQNIIISKRYLDKLAADIVVQTKITKSAEHEVATAQKALLDAAREKKKYEKLKERQLERFRKDNLSSENKELDEFGARSSANRLSHNYHV
jgi:flagellar protein FliJ